jgi:hypothetical protein
MRINRRIKLAIIFAIILVIAGTVICTYVYHQGYKEGYLDRIIDEMTNNNMTDREKAIALFNWTNNHFYHSEPAYSDDPVYCIKYGHGWCLESSIILANLYECAGYDARSTWLLHSDRNNRHVVTEITYNGSWHLFDSDSGMYYSFDNGTVASYDMLITNNSLVMLVSNDSYSPPYNTFKSDINGKGMESFYKIRNKCGPLVNIGTKYINTRHWLMHRTFLKDCEICKKLDNWIYNTLSNFVNRI